MKNYLVLLFLALICSCQDQPSTDKENNAGPTPEPVKEVQVPPTDLSLKDLHWNLRSTLRMELPTTLPDQRGGKMARKSYSFDIEATNDRQPMWVIPEKLHEVESNELYAGGKYMIPFLNVDISSIGLTYSDEQQRVGIIIKSRPGTSFIYHPYSNEPDREVRSVLIGWYDRVQDATLSRALVQLRQLVSKMGEWETE